MCSICFTALHSIFNILGNFKPFNGLVSLEVVVLLCVPFFYFGSKWLRMRTNTLKPRCYIENLYLLLKTNTNQYIYIENLCIYIENNCCDWYWRCCFCWFCCCCRWCCCGITYIVFYHFIAFIICYSMSSSIAFYSIL